MSPRAIALATGYPDTQTRAMLRFLRQIEVVQRIAYKTEEGVRGKPYWKLTKGIKCLFKAVIKEELNNASV